MQLQLRMSEFPPILYLLIFYLLFQFCGFCHWLGNLILLMHVVWLLKTAYIVFIWQCVSFMCIINVCADLLITNDIEILCISWGKIWCENVANSLNHRSDSHKENAEPKWGFWGWEIQIHLYFLHWLVPACVSQPVLGIEHSSREKKKQVFFFFKWISKLQTELAQHCSVFPPPWAAVIKSLLCQR